MTAVQPKQAHPRRFALLVASASAVALLLTACPPPQPEPDATPQGQSTKEVAPIGPVDLADYTEQTIEWQDCGGSDDYLDQIPSEAQCANATVPVDYRDPDGPFGDIEIAMVKLPAEGEEQGLLFVNPGGPGGSGFDYAVNSASDFRRNFPGWSIVGFDPRGVQRSAGFECEQPRTERLRFIEQDFSPESEAEFATNFEFTQNYQAACREAYPQWAFLGTPSVASDLYVMSQAASGGEGLNYFGVSYGSEIGYEYLREYPQSINRMVIESPVDPSVEQTLAEQLIAFNDRVDDLVQDCASEKYSPTCGQGRSPEEVREDLLAALRNIEEGDYETLSSSGAASERLVYYGMILPLYWEWQPQYTQWYTDAIGSLINDQSARDFEYWGYLYENYDFGDQEFGSPDDILEVVRCLDVSEHPDDIDIDAERNKELAQIEQVKDEAPYFYALAFEGLVDDDRFYEPCSYAKEAFESDTLPDPLPEAPAVTNPGDVPVLLMGITGDTATPYEWAQTVAKQLNVPLVTEDTTGHAVYSSSKNACTREIVNDYLDTGQLPAQPQTC